MHNKTIFITGATTGIGKETAKQLAKTGAAVVITARDEQKADSALKEIQNYSGNKNVSCLIAELSSQKSVRELAERFKKTHVRLDVLINNAGMFCTDLKYSADGIEMQFATNHLAYFLLTNLLLDMLKKSAP